MAKYVLIDDYDFDNYHVDESDFVQTLSKKAREYARECDDECYLFVKDTRTNETLKNWTY